MLNRKENHAFNYSAQPAILPLLIGICCSVLLSLYFNFIPSKILIVLAIAISLICYLFQHFFICGLLLGLISIGLTIERPYSEIFHSCTFKASIINPNFGRQRSIPITITAKDIQCKNQRLADQTILFWDNDKYLSRLSSQQLTVSSQLKPVHSRLNPYQFDYEKHLIKNDIRLIATSLTVHDNQPEKQLIYALKNTISNNIINNLPKDSAGIILALVTGNRTALSSSQKTTMQETGSSHILAISGLHLGLLGGLSWLFFQGLWGLSRRLSRLLMPIQAGAIFAFAMITFYALLTGFEIPVKRAWLMFSLLIGSWLYLKTLTTHSLLLAASVVILLDPYSIISEGFYLSFIATFIVLSCIKTSYPALLKIILMQIFITITLFPIIWATFGVIAPVAFFINILIIPWLGTWVLPSVILALLTSMISPELSEITWRILDFTTRALWHVIAYGKSWQLDIYPSYRPEQWLVFLVVTLVIVALLTRKFWILLGWFLIFIPVSFTTNPALIVADSHFTSALIHNGKQAIIMNPGRHYQSTNHAKKWQLYLSRHQLSLSAIVLSDDKISKISATKYLLKLHPKAKVITLKPMALPYAQTFCNAIILENLSLIVEKKQNTCQSHLNWFNHSLTISKSTTEPNAILDESILKWNNKQYDARQLGAVSLISHQNNIRLTYAREKATIWKNSQ